MNTWPSSSDYNEAIQNLATSVGDEELRAGRAERDKLGLPMPYAGNFADVYRIDCPATGNSWAVKCFTREVADLRDRYRAISEHLDRVKLPFMTDFRYLEEGLRINGRWYPIVKMRWVEGIGLNDFVSRVIDQPEMLRGLADLWLNKVVDRLENAKIAHADLQHGNVLLVPVPERNSVRLTLIDYDGMYVPALTGRGSGERGHPAFQHPQRICEGAHNANVDRFSHLAIYTALQCLAEDPTLWDQYNNGENLLFRQSDFANPSDSELFRRLWALNENSTTKTLVGWLILASQDPLDSTPRLCDIIQNARVASLMPMEQRRILQCFGQESGPGEATHKTDLLTQENVQATTAPSLFLSTRPIGRRLIALIGHNAAVKSVALTPDKHCIVTGGWDGTIFFWDAISGEPLDRRTWHAGAVNAVAVSPSGLHGASGSSDKTAILWDVPSKTLRHQLRGHRGFVTSVAFSPNGGLILTGSRDCTALLWDCDGRLVRQFAGHGGPVSSVAFSPDGTQILTGSHDSSAILWDIESAEAIRSYCFHDTVVSAVSFSPDGRRILTGSWDSMAILWDVTDGQLPVQILYGHSSAVTSVTFNSDGKRILTGSFDRSAILWDSETGEELRLFTGHDDFVSSVAFSVDDLKIVTSSEDGTAVVWESGLERGRIKPIFKRLLAQSAMPDIVALSQLLGNGLVNAAKQRAARVCRSAVKGASQVLRDFFIVNSN